MGALCTFPVYADLGAGGGVQIAGGLVAHHYAGVVDQRPRDRDALLLTAGKLAGNVAHAVPQPHEGEHPDRDPENGEKRAQLAAEYVAQSTDGPPLGSTSPVMIARYGVVTAAPKGTAP